MQQVCAPPMVRTPLTQTRSVGSHHPRPTIRAFSFDAVSLARHINLQRASSSARQSVRILKKLNGVNLSRRTMWHGRTAHVDVHSTEPKCCEMSRKTALVPFYAFGCIASKQIQTLSKTNTLTHARTHEQTIHNNDNNRSM